MAVPITGKVLRFVFVLPGWEVVQLVGLQTLDLAILVRVQASQPNRTNGLRETKYLAVDMPFTGLSWLQPVSVAMGPKWGQQIFFNSSIYIDSD